MSTIMGLFIFSTVIILSTITWYLAIDFIYKKKGERLSNAENSVSNPRITNKEAGEKLNVQIFLENLESGRGVGTKYSNTSYINWFIGGHPIPEEILSIFREYIGLKVDSSSLSNIPTELLREYNYLKEKDPDKIRIINDKFTPILDDLELKMKHLNLHMHSMNRPEITSEAEVLLKVLSLLMMSIGRAKYKNAFEIDIKVDKLFELALNYRNEGIDGNDN